MRLAILGRSCTPRYSHHFVSPQLSEQDHLLVVSIDPTVADELVLAPYSIGSSLLGEFGYKLASEAAAS